MSSILVVSFIIPFLVGILSSRTDKWISLLISRMEDNLHYGNRLLGDKIENAITLAYYESIEKILLSCIKMRDSDLQKYKEELKTITRRKIRAANDKSYSKNALIIDFNEIKQLVLKNKKNSINKLKKKIVERALSVDHYDTRHYQNEVEKNLFNYMQKHFSYQLKNNHEVKEAFNSEVLLILDYKIDDILEKEDSIIELLNTLVNNSNKNIDIDLIEEAATKEANSFISQREERELTNNSVKYVGKLIGREFDLEAIEDKLVQYNVVYIQSMGGIGKTELAKGLYFKYYNNTNLKLTWITYNDNFMESLIKAFIKDQQHDNSQNNDINRFYSIVKQLLHYKDELIVFIDNFDKTNDKYFKYFIENISSKIIVTSRIKREIPNEINLKPLRYDKCRELLMENLKFHINEELIEDIIIKVKKHTLTLKRYGKVVNYLLRYNVYSSYEEIHNIVFEKGHFDSALIDNFAVVSIDEENSYDFKIRDSFTLIKLSKGEKNALIKLSLVCNLECDVSFAAECKIANISIIKSLDEKAWIDYINHENSHSISMHPIILSIVKEKAYSDSQIILEMIDAINIKMMRDLRSYGFYEKPINSLKYMMYVENFLNNVFYAKKIELDEIEKKLDFCINAAEIFSILFLVEMMDRVISCGIICLEKYKNDFKSYFEYKSRFYFHKSMVYYHKEDFKNALDFCNKSFNIRTNKLKNYQIEKNYDLYGKIYSRQRNYEKALAYEELAFKIRSNKFNNDSVEIAKSYNSMGVTLYYEERYEDAIKLLKKALNIRKKHYNYNEHIELAYTYNTLGLAQMQREEYSEALVNILESRRIRKIKLGELHPHTILLTNNLGLVYGHLNDYNRSIKYLVTALIQRKTVLEPNHTDISTTQKYLGEVYLKVRKPRKAIKYLEEAIKIRKSKEIYIHPKGIALIYELFVIAYIIDKDYKNAEEYLKLEKKYTSECSTSLLERESICDLINHNEVKELSDESLAYNIYIKGIKYRIDGDVEKSLEYLTIVLNETYKPTLYFNKFIVIEELLDLYLYKKDNEMFFKTLLNAVRHIKDYEKYWLQYLLDKYKEFFLEEFNINITNFTVEDMKMNKVEKVTNFVRENSNNTRVLLSENMSKYTSFKTGGKADIVIECYSKNELTRIIEFLSKEQIDYLVFGHCTNVIVSDDGIRDVIIRIDDNLSKIYIEDEYVIAEAGALFSDVSVFAMNNSLSGFEYACGIPGTIGGAVFMNAGAYGGEVKDHLVEAEVIDNEGNIITLTNEELEMGYRKSKLQETGGIVVKAKFKVTKSDKEIIHQDMKELTKRREDKQPLEYPSAGSIFKRPEGYFTGKLIQEANLKGYTIGGAQVSEKHAGFIINIGDATSEDIYNLIRYIQNKIFELNKVKLETEVKIIGNFFDN